MGGCSLLLQADQIGLGVNVVDVVDSHAQVAAKISQEMNVVVPLPLLLTYFNVHRGVSTHTVFV